MRMIDADTAKQTYTADLFDTEEDFERVNDIFDYAPTVEAVVVTRCKDCIYTRKLYGRLVCKYGTCSGCILREDFFCANGERKEDA